MKLSALWMAALCASRAVAPAVAPPAPGEYVTRGRWGNLSIEKDGTFSIDSVGPNAHLCGLEGRLSGPFGETATKPACRFELVQNSRDHWKLRIAETDREACRNYCGARASFDHDYFADRPGCDGPALERSRAVFDGQYRARQFGSATATLEALFARCGGLIRQPTAENLANDLALAYHRAHQDAECLRVLKPLADNYATDPPWVSFPPADADWGEPLIRKTRFNWKLCGGPPVKR